MATPIDYSTNSYGTVIFNGVTVQICEQAHVINSGTDGGVAYIAAGVDEEGLDYEIRWETTPEWDEMQERHREERHGEKFCDCCDDESEACDWTKYTVRLL